MSARREFAGVLLFEPNGPGGNHRSGMRGEHAVFQVRTGRLKNQARAGHHHEVCRPPSINHVWPLVVRNGIVPYVTAADPAAAGLPSKLGPHPRDRGMLGEIERSRRGPQLWQSFGLQSQGAHVGRTATGPTCLFQLPAPSFLDGPGPATSSTSSVHQAKRGNRQANHQARPGEGSPPRGTRRRHQSTRRPRVFAGMLPRRNGRPSQERGWRTGPSVARAEWPDAPARDRPRPDKRRGPGCQQVVPGIRGVSVLPKFIFPGGPFRGPGKIQD